MPLGQVIAFDAGRGSPESLKPLLDLVATDMEAINRIILDKHVSDVELIPELAHHLIDSGGKRLRPMLALAACKLCGYSGTGHIRVASAIEFMHTATLLHDDVVDESGLRRGKQTARMLWGNQASVLVGDFLLGQAFRTLVDVGSLPVLRILSNAAAVIAEGEVMQLAAAKNTATSEDEYLAVIRAKTAELFAAFEKTTGSSRSIDDVPTELAGFIDWLKHYDNDLTRAAASRVPMIADILRALKAQPGCQLARMSGSGATCFGVFGSVDQVRLAAEQLQSQRPEWWVCKTILR